MSLKANKRKSGFYIGVGCPGCGGEVELAEDFFVTTCRHCSSVLRIVMPSAPPAFMVRCNLQKRELRFNLDRFLKERGLPLTDSDLQVKKLYYPYWRVEAQMLRLRNKVETRVLCDETGQSEDREFKTRKTSVKVSPYTVTVSAGIDLPGLPNNIGQRSEYMKLIPFAEGNVQEGFDVIPISRPIDEVMRSVNISVGAVAAATSPDFGRNITEMFNPKYSLVYFPFFVVETYDDGARRFVIDGLTGHVLNQDNPYDNLQLLAESPSAIVDSPPIETDDGEDVDVELGQLSVEFHRCSNCGIDLPDEKSSVYICGNCQVLTNMESSAIDLRSVQSVIGDKPSDLLFPFWALKIPPGDVIGLKRMFGGIHDSDSLVIPAFRLPNSESMFRLAKRISVAMPRFDLAEIFKFDNRHQPVSLGSVEAIAMANILIYRETLARRTGFKVEKRDFQPVEIDLFYAPFHLESYFFVDSVLQAVTFEKVAVE